MSTKISHARSENFHLYSEAFDDDRIYLQIEGCEFQAERDRVTVAIPLAIWAVIRERAPVDLSNALLSDEEIQEAVTGTVDRRITKYRETPDGKGREVANLLGAGIYGLASSPRTEQIAQGVQFYQAERERQRAIAAEIEKYRKEVQ